MGLNLIGSGCGCSRSYPRVVTQMIEKEKIVKEPNPNPRNFRVDKVIEEGGFAIAEIYYPDCTNFEGKKILVFEGVTELDLRRMDFIDPHFCDRGHLTPIARFEPTEKGWGLAWAMCQIRKAL